MKAAVLLVFIAQIWLVPSITFGFQAIQNDNAKNKSDSTTQIKAVSVTTLVEEIDTGASGLTVDQQGHLYLGDWGPRWDGRVRTKPGTRVFKISPDGYVTLFSRETHGASGNAIDEDGNFFQASFLGSFITKFRPDGKVVGVVRKGLDKPTGIAIDEDGQLFVCNCYGNSIQKVTPDGKSMQFCKNSDLLNNPIGIACAGDNTLYVSNSANGDIIKISPNGEATKLATLPPHNGYLTMFEGSLYVAARTDHRIYRVALDGTVTPFAGSGMRGNSDASPEKCSFSSPVGIAVSPHGKYMYVSEVSPTEGDNSIISPTRIRRIELTRIVDN